MLVVELSPTTATVTADMVQAQANTVSNVVGVATSTPRVNPSSISSGICSSACAYSDSPGRNITTTSGATANPSQ